MAAGFCHESRREDTREDIKAPPAFAGGAEKERKSEMGGLRFDSAAEMPEGMRKLYAQKALPAAREAERGRKYHNVATETAGIRFDSKKEARRYAELIDLLRAGQIEKLKLQPQFTMQESFLTEKGQRVRAIRYTADFSYLKNGKLMVEDVKTRPTRTKEFLRNKKMMVERFGIEVQEV